MKTKVEFMKKTSALLSVLFLFLSSCGNNPSSSNTNRIQEGDVRYSDDNERGYRNDDRDNNDRRDYDRDRHDNDHRDHDRDRDNDDDNRWWRWW